MWWLFAFAGASPLGFEPGHETLDEPFVSAERCGACHANQAAQWAASRHAVAHSNAIYQQGLQDEPMAFCVRCHSPLADQAAEVEPLVAEWASRPRSQRIGESTPGDAAGEGITCVVCHVRDGQILASHDSGRSPHDVRIEPALATSDWCGSCHQFEMFRATPEGLTFTGDLMQATLSEWQAWKGRRTCQDCHMPDGAHTFAGAHDVEALRASVQVRVRGDVLRIRSVGVGHALPTGDLFRNLSVEADQGDGYSIVYTLGRRWRVDDTVHPPVKRLAEDTSLQPGEWVQVDLPAGSRSWRVQYHYGSLRDENRAGEEDTDWVVTLHNGEL